MQSVCVCVSVLLPAPQRTGLKRGTTGHQTAGSFVGLQLLINKDLMVAACWKTSLGQSYAEKGCPGGCPVTCWGICMCVPQLYV